MDQSDGANLSFRIGRWQMNYGGQKMISPLGWFKSGKVLGWNQDAL